MAQNLPEDPEQVRMPFSAHLEELRGRLMRVVIVIGVIFFGGWVFFSRALREIFLHPHQVAIRLYNEANPDNLIDSKLKVFDYLEAVFFNLKIALTAALVIGLPFALYQMWAFIAAGLYPHERKTISRFMPFSLMFAIAGILFGYLFMIPQVLSYLLSLIDFDLMDDSLRLSRYFAIFMMFELALVIIFQLPMILLALATVGLVDSKTLRKYRRHFILGAFVISALFTPPEPFSQILMAVPTVLLFELGILLVAWRERRKPAEANPAPVQETAE